MSTLIFGTVRLCYTCFLILFSCLLLPARGADFSEKFPLEIKRTDTMPDTSRAMYYVYLSRLYKIRNYDSSYFYADLAFKTSRNVNFIKGEAYAMKYMGEIYWAKGNIDTVPVFYEAALKLFRQSGNEQGEAETYFMIGSFHYDQGNYSEMREYYMKSVSMYRKLNVTRRPHFILNEIGAMNYYEAKYPQALYYYYQGLSYDLEMKDTKLVASTLNNIALVFEKQGDWERAMKYYRLSYRLCLQQGFKELIPSVLINMGKLNSKQDSNRLALRCMLRSLKYSDIKDSSEDLSDTYNNIAEIYLKMKEPDSALRYLDSNAQLVLNPRFIKLRQNYLKLRSHYYESKNDIVHAYAVLKEYNYIVDSLFREHKERTVKATYVRGTLKQREKQIKSLAATNHIQEQEIRHHRFNLVVLLVIMLLIAMIAVILYFSARAKTRVNRVLQELDKERNTLIGIVSHDLKAPLASIQSFTELIDTSEAKLDEEQHVYLQYIRQTIENSFEMINNVMDLSRVYDKNIKAHKSLFDVSVVLREVVNHFKVQAAKKGISLVSDKLEGPYEQILGDPMHIKRIAENLISNAIKFSPPNSKVTISMLSKGNHIQFHVRDEGPGIKASEQERLFKKYERLSAMPTGNESSSGLGLYIVKELTALNKGSVWCESEEGQGASFKVSFPKA